jgi:hypothetical protein
MNFSLPSGHVDKDTALYSGDVKKHWLRENFSCHFMTLDIENKKECHLDKMKCYHELDLSKFDVK